jgi:5'-nucleotidase
MQQPLRAALISTNNSQWVVNGTPADCVKLALEHLLKNRLPDLIISGINRGSNLGGDILYSGTVSAAIEGSFYKIPSIATSLAGYSDLDFNQAAAFIANNLQQLKELAFDTVLNLNFPVSAGAKDYKGALFTKLGIRTYQNVIAERQDPRGQNYFWMGGEPVNQNQEPDSDVKAVDDGYISITPLHSDLTNYAFLEKNGSDTNKLSIN